MWTLICHHLEVILKWCRNDQMRPEWKGSKNPDIEKRLHSASIRHSRIIWGGFEWRGMRISMERTSFKLHFVQSEVNADTPVTHEWSWMTGWQWNEGVFQNQGRTLNSEIVLIPRSVRHSIPKSYCSRYHSIHFGVIRSFGCHPKVMSL